MILDYEKSDILFPDEIKKIDTRDVLELSRAYNYPYYKRYFYYVNNKLCHLKTYYMLSNYLVNELLGRLLSCSFGCESVELKFFLSSSACEFYLISDNFINKNLKYTSLNSESFSLNFKYNRNNISLIERIDNLNFNLDDLKILKRDLKRMVIIDFILKGYDRAFRNFMIMYNNKNIKLMPLYDFEFSFLESDSDFSNAFEFDFNDYDEVSYIRNDMDFQRILYNAMNINMKKIIDEFHDKYPIRLDKDEISKYNSIVTGQQEEIMRRKLIK